MQDNLQHKSSKIKELLRYVIPSMGAMLVSALYSVVDGIFVGRGVGDVGLAAVNLSIPLLGFLAAMAVMLVMGSATIAAVSIGAGNKERANDIFSNTTLLVGGLSLIFTLLCLCFADRFAAWSGAEGELLVQTATYMRSYLGFGFFFAVSYLLSAFVRNDGNPTLAFWGMASGTVCNIFLDWLFIFPLNMGILGAGLASGIGTVLSFSILITHFLRKQGDLRLRVPKFSKLLTAETIKRGFPEFITQMYGPVLIYCSNFVIMRIYGESGISSFSMIAYLLSVMIAMSSGVAQGVQPLVSRSFGEGNHAAEKYYFKTGLITNFIITAITYGLVLITGKQIYHVFSSDADIINLAYYGTYYAGVAMIISTINVSHASYFLSTQRTKQAMLLAVARSFVFTAPIVLLTPVIFGDSAVWCGMIASELCVAVLSVILYQKLPKYCGSAQ